MGFIFRVFSIYLHERVARGRKITKTSFNNYLLTGNKVALFSPRQTRDILLPER